MSGDDLLGLLAPLDSGHPFGWLDGLLLGGLLVVCGIIVRVDIRARIIPDPCNALVALFGIGFASLDGLAAAASATLQGILGFLAFWLFRAAYNRIRGHHGLGFGDVKFLGGAATWIGLGGLPPLILIACFIALAALGVARLRGQTITASYAIPFGPFLVAGLLGTLATRLG